MKNKLLKLNKKTNLVGIILTITVIFLVCFGALMVYSASFYSATKTYNNKYFFLIKQVVGIVIGLVSMFLLSKVNYNKLQKFVPVALVVSFVLLILVFVSGIGVENYGAKRWINLGFFTIQPSEIAKFSLVLFASSYLSKNQNKIKTFRDLLPVLLVGGLMCLLIILEPNMSITMCVGLVMVLMLIIGGMSKKHFFMLLIPALLLVPVLIIIEPYRFNRLLAFINPWASPKGEGYQLVQSFFSIGSGGIFGVGLFNSRQKFLFLPFAESDFIFSVIAEELGLMGAVFVLILFFVVIACGIKIALSCKNRFGCYLASGITLVIAIQTMLNIAVVTGLIPPTGLPLPFISSGSTSIVVFMSAIGVLLNINKQNMSSYISNENLTNKSLFSAFKNLFKGKPFIKRKVKNNKN